MSDQFVFKMRAVQRPDDPYYVTNWDRAIPVEVVADTQKGALVKAEQMLGPAVAHRHWVFHVDSVRDFMLEKEKKNE